MRHLDAALHQALGEDEGDQAGVEEDRPPRPLGRLLGLHGRTQRVETDDARQGGAGQVERQRLGPCGHEQPVVPDALAGAEDDLVVGGVDGGNRCHQEQVNPFPSVGVAVLEDEFGLGEVPREEVAELPPQVERVAFARKEADLGGGAGAAERLGGAEPGRPVADDDEMPAHRWSVPSGGREGSRAARAAASARCFRCTRR